MAAQRAARYIDYDAVFERVIARLPQLVQQIHRQREEASGLLAEIRSLPPERRRRALEDPRFENPALVDLLLDASEAALRQEPAEAEELARLATALATRSEPTPDGLALIFARAHSIAANAQRRRVQP